MNIYSKKNKIIRNETKHHLQIKYACFFQKPHFIPGHPADINSIPFINQIYCLLDIKKFTAVFLFCISLFCHFKFIDTAIAGDFKFNNNKTGINSNNYESKLDSQENILFEKFSNNFENYYKPEIKLRTGNVIIAVRSIKNGKIIFTNDYGSLSNKKIAPGSVLKIACAAFFLENQAFDETADIFCGDSIILNGKYFNCSYKGGHGRVNFEHAFINSCNIYFQKMMKKFPRKSYLNFLTGMKFIDNSEKNKLAELTDEFYYQAVIGDHLIKATPDILMNSIEFIALCGGLKQHNINLRLSHKTFQKLNSLLYSVTRSGTASKVLSNYDIAGKTGSSLKYAIISHNKKTTYTSGIFCGYMPYINPQYIIFAYCENGMGGNEAAELVKNVIFN